MSRSDRDQPIAGIDRRTLLRRTALLSAGAAFLGCLSEALPRPTGLFTAPAEATALSSTVCLDKTVLDCLSGVSAFVIPGSDPYSAHQGVSSTGPGAVEAGAAQALAVALDQVLLDPTMLAKLIDALNTALGPLPQEKLGSICVPIGSAIPQPGGVALSAVIAALLDVLALQVDPASISGSFTSPFARLSWTNKAEVWRRFEVDIPALLLPPTWQIGAPVIGVMADVFETLGGLLDYASGAVLELVGLLTYTEGLAYDRSTGRLTSTPIGWRLTSYQLGQSFSVDGWPEFHGYYQGRTTAHA